MSRVSLKKDFKDGEILYGGQVNTNSRAAELGINDNYEEILKLKDIKADVEDMTEALALKVNTSTFDEAISSLNTTKANLSLVNTKADKTAVALKADKTYVDSQLATKANSSNLGDLNSLNTDNKSSAVAAINELNAKSGSAAKDIDNLSITTNNSDKLQASGIIDSNDSNVIRTWTGTKAEYDAIGTKNARTLYYITDDEEYVKFTDYATSEKGGVFKLGNGIINWSDGTIGMSEYDFSSYTRAGKNLFISKGTLENVLNARIGDIETALDTIQGEVI